METLVHGTCVALGGSCALLCGMPGAGKSDLALRFLFLPSDALGGRPALVADDQVLLRRIGDHVVASCPPILSGRIEVRGSGIARAGAVTAKARLTIVADLDGSASTPRFPENDQWKSILGLPIRRIVLDPFEISAPIKLALALQNVLEDRGD
ncbi:MAG: HPr kinase/phosphatase C-terminal domain-containing protein [Rhodomicrobium sp.]